MTRVDGVTQVFIRRNGKLIILLVQKVIDYYLGACKNVYIEGSFSAKAGEFEVVKMALGEPSI